MLTDTPHIIITHSLSEDTRLLPFLAAAHSADVSAGLHVSL